MSSSIKPLVGQSRFRDLPRLKSIYLTLKGRTFRVSAEVDDTSLKSKSYL